VPGPDAVPWGPSAAVCGWPLLIPRVLLWGLCLRSQKGSYTSLVNRGTHHSWKGLNLDKAHIYCPERGSGEAESTEAVISLMSQGRKRGYAGVIATQRLSKLHKDAAAEANNAIIGRTWLDADQVRAGDALGLSKADRLKLRDVGQGEFYAFGPALGQRGVMHFGSDQVRTTHPRPGERHPLTAPAPSGEIRGVPSGSSVVIPENIIRR
jgi:hypothetical protein